MDHPSESEQRQSVKAGAITIKKYANRRLYNTATSCYVTLDYLSQLVKTGAEFIVYDAKTGEDITRSVLTHIIVEEEAKGHSLLPVSFLRHLISFYGDSLQALVPRYLEQVMHAFALNQQNMREGMRDTFDGLMPFGRFEEMSKQQLALFERAMRMFNPFFGEEQEAPEKSETPNTPVAESQIEELRGRLNSIQKQLDELADRRAQKTEH
jgi:polyhydroxyalkanoate synthesis repressor PhaR